MSLLNLRRAAKASMVTAVAFAGISLMGAQPAAAATEGTTGMDCWAACGKLTNSTDHGVSVTLEWGTSDAQRWQWERWVFAHSSMGGNASGVDVDGVYIPGGCTAFGNVYGFGYVIPVVWGGGWHKIQGDQNANLVGVYC
ncbi:hypothetical protein [Streptomyces sp. NBC_01233]|uniref:hypothetical protein n=1 Tax=Streptomyces sp. NBC_01233 TaxID=2903787 RepID=UPI002E0F51C2|nr:hypothetical protein OG332_22350 [Streptomyces sp. NBC_01233]